MYEILRTWITPNGTFYKGYCNTSETWANMLNVSEKEFISKLNDNGYNFWFNKNPIEKEDMFIYSDNYHDKKDGQLYFIRIVDNNGIIKIIDKAIFIKKDLYINSYYDYNGKNYLVNDVIWSIEYNDAFETLNDLS